VLDRICERLACDSDLDASDIDVSVQEGLVILAGSVPSRHARRDAAAIAESTHGAREVENRLHVRHQDTAAY
jgi:osmotically-inducible protein OsmY